MKSLRNLILLCSTLATSFVWPAIISEHLRFGIPGYNPANSNYKLITRQGYALLHNNIRKGPTWVSYRLTKAYLANNVTRASQTAFQPDPELPIGQRAELSDYKKSGWDRGHMAPSRDMRRTETIQNECFYLSNMVPQDGPLNRGIWNKLEATVRDYADQYGEIFVITGSIYTKPLPNGEKYKSIGKNQVQVPTWLYKIIIKPSVNNQVSVLAFEMPNIALPTTDSLSKYLVSLNTLEKDCQLKFLNALPVKMQQLVKARRPATIWPVKDSAALK
jgi:endonuclease G